MNSETIDLLSPEALARLLNVEKERAWSAEDAPAALRHQLEAALLPDLETAPWAEAARWKARLGERAEKEKFADQLMGPAPAVELLQAIKRWAREMREQVSSPLYGMGATVIYYAAIAAGIARLGERLSSLPDEQLRTGFMWARGQVGAEKLADVFSDGLARLKG